MQTLIGLLGGAFDPVHLGHLHIAKQLLKGLPFSSIRFVPCNQPTHREPLVATPTQRLALLKLALQDEIRASDNTLASKLIIDRREIDRGGISYTIDTLKAIRKEDPTQPYALIMSSEAFSHFDTWKDWEMIPTFVHLVVVDRPGYVFSQPICAERRTTDSQDLLTTPAGKLFYYPIKPGLNISATAIRKKLKHSKVNRESSTLTELSPTVAHYIQHTGLYRE